MYAEKLIRKGVEILDESSVVSLGCMCGRFLQQAGVRRPFVVTSHAGFLEDLRTAGITEYMATIDDDGSPQDVYKKYVTEQSVREFVDQHPMVDAIVLGADQELTPFKLAVIVEFLARGQAKGNAETAAASKFIPLVSCCPPHARRKVQAMARASTLQRVRAHFEAEGAFGIELRLPSAGSFQWLCSSEDEGGYGIDPSKAVMVGDSLEVELKLAREAGMKSLLVINSISSSVEPAAAPPDWILPSFADA